MTNATATARPLDSHRRKRPDMLAQQLSELLAAEPIQAVTVRRIAGLLGARRDGMARHVHATLTRSLGPRVGARVCRELMATERHEAPQAWAHARQLGVDRLAEQAARLDRLLSIAQTRIDAPSQTVRRFEQLRP